LITLRGVRTFFEKKVPTPPKNFEKIIGGIRNVSVPDLQSGSPCGTPAPQDGEKCCFHLCEYVKFLKIVKKLFSKSFLPGVWGSAPTV
jgi:hypothetical protein